MVSLNLDEKICSILLLFPYGLMNQWQWMSYLIDNFFRENVSILGTCWMKKLCLFMSWQRSFIKAIHSRAFNLFLYEIVRWIYFINLPPKKNSTFHYMSIKKSSYLKCQKLSWFPQKVRPRILSNKSHSCFFFVHKTLK